MTPEQKSKKPFYKMSATAPKKASSREKSNHPARSKIAADCKPFTTVLFNKPFNVLCQFTDENDRAILKDFIDIPNIYAAGRLDFDSEGLLLLTNDGALANKITSPKHKTNKTYWAQVEGIPSKEDIHRLAKGVQLKDGITAPAKISIMRAPNIWDRNPPIRQRKHIPTAWLSITISEGRNRQVRRMTAHIGHPTLRLIRYAIGKWTLDGVDNGEYLTISGDG